MKPLLYTYVHKSISSIDEKRVPFKAALIEEIKRNLLGRRQGYRGVA